MKVSFQNIKAGWVDLEITINNAVVLNQSVSYTPHDSFSDLIETLHLLKDSASNVEKVVFFSTEPEEYEFRFRKIDTDVALNVITHRDHRTIRGTEEKVFSLSGKYEKVCLPFWRGMRNLQGKHTPEELSRHWHRAFPNEELNELTEVIKRQKKA